MMPKGTHAGVSNAGEIEETFVARADGEVQEVNVSTSQDAEYPAPTPLKAGERLTDAAPKPEKAKKSEDEKAKDEEEGSPSPGNSSSPSQQTSEPTKPQKRASR